MWLLLKGNSHTLLIYVINLRVLTNMRQGELGLGAKSSPLPVLDQLERHF